MVLSLMLLALAGGDCVDDLKVLQSDEGFCKILQRIEPEVSSPRWRTGKSRTVPSPSSVFRYLAAFRTDQVPVQGSASIPDSSTLKGFTRINRDLAAALQRKSISSTATLDMDATLIETAKKDALFCYDGYKAYQPLNVFWAEQEFLVHTEFRDGNVPANYDLLRVFEEALAGLPEGIERVRLRSDAAGYSHDLLSYCDKGKNERFGRIEFAVSCPVTEAFKKEVRILPCEEWKRLDTHREWAEVGLTPDVNNGHHIPLRRSSLGVEFPFICGWG
jgi:hypothetical protein